MIEKLEELFHRWDIKDDNQYKTLVVFALITIAQEIRRLYEK